MAIPFFNSIIADIENSLLTPTHDVARAIVLISKPLKANPAILVLGVIAWASVFLIFNCGTLLFCTAVGIIHPIYVLLDWQSKNKWNYWHHWPTYWFAYVAIILVELLQPEMSLNAFDLYWTYRTIFNVVYVQYSLYKVVVPVPFSRQEKPESKETKD